MFFGNEKRTCLLGVPVRPDVKLASNIFRHACSEVFVTLDHQPAALSCTLNSYTDLPIPAGTHLSSASPFAVVKSEIVPYARLETDFERPFYTQPKLSFGRVALGFHYKLLCYIRKFKGRYFHHILLCPVANFPSALYRFKKFMKGNSIVSTRTFLH